MRSQETTIIRIRVPKRLVRRAKELAAKDYRTAHSVYVAWLMEKLESIERVEAK